LTIILASGGISPITNGEAVTVTIFRSNDGKRGAKCTGRSRACLLLAKRTDGAVYPHHLAWIKVKIGIADLATNMRRMVWLTQNAALA
jgi:hypothetical protein